MSLVDNAVNAIIKNVGFNEWCESEKENNSANETSLSMAWAIASYANDMIVRCKDCVYYDSSSGMCKNEFGIADNEVFNCKPDDYCSRSERK